MLRADCSSHRVSGDPVAWRGPRPAKRKLAGAVLTLCLAVWLSRNWLDGGWEKSFVREALPLSLPLVPHLLLALGLVAADRLILQHYRSMEEVGLYSLAYTFGMMMFLVTASVAQAWSPVFYRMASQGETKRSAIGRVLAAILLLLGTVAVFGVAVADPFIRGVLDPRYWQAGPLVPLVIGGYLFHAVFALFQMSALHARKAQFVWVEYSGANCQPGAELRVGSEVGYVWRGLGDHSGLCSGRLADVRLRAAGVRASGKGSTPLDRAGGFRRPARDYATLTAEWPPNAGDGSRLRP